jgi:hypothetical protein
MSEQTGGVMTMTHTKSDLFAPGISGRGDLAPTICWAGNRGYSIRIWYQSWNSKKLTQFGRILSAGYDPGLGDDPSDGQAWTTKNYVRMAKTLGRGYNPGL